MSRVGWHTKECGFVLGNAVPDHVHEHRAVFSCVSAWTTLQMIVQSFVYKLQSQWWVSEHHAQADCSPRIRVLGGREAEPKD